MGDYYSISLEQGITIITFHSKPDYEQVKSVIDELAAKEIYLKRLWDLSEIKFDFSHNDIKKIAEYGKVVFTRPNKAAICATDDLAYGEMNQFQVYREDDNITTKIFRHRQEAIYWLLCN